VTRAIIIGQSHCEAIGQALEQQRNRYPDICVHRLQDKRSRDNTISMPDALELIAGLPADTSLFFAVLGGYHNLLGLVRSGKNFDFLLRPDDRPDPETKIIVPHRAVASAFEEQFSEAAKIRNLIVAANCRLFLLSSPPPKGDNDYIMERFRRPKNRIYRDKVVAEFGIERPETRLKLWQMEQGLMDQWAQTFGMQFLPAPGSAFDSKGFLKEDYYEDDVTHANSGYGALVLEQVAGIVRTRGQRVLNG
jgi:hypothetical protein